MQVELWNGPHGKVLVGSRTGFQIRLCFPSRLGDCAVVSRDDAIDLYIRQALANRVVGRFVRREVVASRWESGTPPGGWCAT